MWDQPVRFAPTTAVYYESGSYIVHNYAIHSWIVVSRDDYAVISRLQYQRMTPNEAVSWLVSHRGLSAAEARRKVGRLILLLRANKIAALPGEPFAEPPGEVKRTVPKVVYFVATYRCNLACAYCYAESSPQAETVGDLTTAEAMAMIDQVADLGVKAMAFTGGEALMRRDCIDLIEHAKARRASGLPDHQRRSGDAGESAAAGQVAHLGDREHGQPVRGRGPRRDAGRRFVGAGEPGDRPLPGGRHSRRCQHHGDGGERRAPARDGLMGPGPRDPFAPHRVCERAGAGRVGHGRIRS